MAQDETDAVARLAEALAEAGCPWPSSRLLAAALLPAVREIADERAAEALTAVAEGWESVPAQRLIDRAAELLRPHRSTKGAGR